VTSSEDLSLLGAPVTSAGIPTALRRKVEALKRLYSRLPALHAHSALYLLKNCLALPKLLYLLRCSPTFLASEELKYIDDTLRSCLETITNSKLEDSQWNQATLPVSTGGLGLGNIHELATPAYLASVHGFSALIRSILPARVESAAHPTIHAALALWTTRSDEAPPSAVASQKSWLKPLQSKRYLEMLTSQTTGQSRARLLGVSAPESGAWLQALPVPSLGTFLDDNSLRVAVGLRLGTKLCEPHTCRCGAQVQQDGAHGLSCKRSAGRFSRHSALNDVIKRALSSAGVPAILEPPGLCRADGKRPDGLSLIPWSCGKSLLWDATCVDTVAVSHMPKTSSSAGAAAESMANKKMAKYACFRGQYHFVPVAVETLGAWSKDALDFLKSVGRRIEEHTGKKRSTVFLFQRISMAIQRGNAISVLGTLPLMNQLDEIFYLV